MGTLYVVGTPIGNLSDMTPRAAETLRAVDLIAAEDTRVTRRLLNFLGVNTPCISYHDHSRPAQLERILDALDSGNVAQVSDAGSPAVSDPGAELARAAGERGHQVVTVPGPSAVTAALSVSGMPADRFLFIGFLPRRRADRRAVLAGAMAETGTLVAFETPQRLLAALDDIRQTLGDRRIAVCRELTKLHEEVFRGSVTEAGDYFNGRGPRGEFVLVIDGAPEQDEEISDEELAGTLRRLRETGLAGRRLVDAAVETTGAARSRVYRMAIDQRSEEPQQADQASDNE